MPWTITLTVIYTSPGAWVVADAHCPAVDLVGETVRRVEAASDFRPVVIGVSTWSRVKDKLRSGKKVPNILTCILNDWKYLMLPRGQHCQASRMKMLGVTRQTHFPLILTFDFYVCQQLDGYKCDSTVWHSVSLILTFMARYHLL